MTALYNEYNALSILLNRWVGGQVGALHQVESTIAASGAAEELVINVDGGHINKRNSTV